MLAQLQPSDIRFKQDSIKKEFQDGRSVNEAALDLCRGSLMPSDFPLIRVVKYNSKIYSFDNRRLYVFRVAQYNGYVDYIKVKVASASQFNLDTFTTTNDGREVEVRGDRTLAHCKTLWLRDSPVISPHPTLRRPYYQPHAISIRPKSATYDATFETTSRASAFGEGTRSSSFRASQDWSERNRRNSRDVCSCVIL